MNIITLFIALVIGFMIIGLVAAMLQNKDAGDESQSEENSSRIVITQEVPSVFDTFKGRGK